MGVINGKSPQKSDGCLIGKTRRFDGFEYEFGSGSATPGASLRKRYDSARRSAGSCAIGRLSDSFEEVQCVAIHDRHSEVTW